MSRQRLWACLRRGQILFHSWTSVPRSGILYRGLNPMLPLRCDKGYSTRSKVNRFLQTRVSFTFTTILWGGVCGSLIIYALKKREKSKQKNKQRPTHATHAGDSELQQFRNKVVVITGAAGDIGGATASRFAHEGATLVLVDLPQLKTVLEDKCKTLKKEGASNVILVTADVTNCDSVQEMVKQTVENVGRIDFFFNNAGIQGELRPLHEQKDEEFERVMNVNIFGVFLGMKYVAKAMIEAGNGGVIVNTASLAGLVGPGNMSAYAASKFAVVGMTKTAAKDFAPHGIRVCAIAPGILEGKMWSTQIKGNVLCRKKLIGDESDITEEDLRLQEERMINDTPLRRLGKLSEVASVVAFLCSDDASYLTGVTIPIEGGKLR